MFQKMRKKLGNKKGFTLIELIVVIAVLGVLSMIAIPRITGIQEDARKSTDIANARTLATTIAANIANGNLTADKTGLVVASANLVDTGTDHLSEILNAFPSGVPVVQTSSTSGTNNDVNAKNFMVTYTVSTGTITIFVNVNDADHQLYPKPGKLFK